MLPGGVNILGQLTNEDLKAFVNYNEIVNDTLGIVEPYFQMPKFTYIINQEPETLKYTIKKF